MLIYLVNISSSENIMFALIITLFIFILMSGIVYIFPKFFEESFHFVYPGLFIGLLTIILIELYYLFIKGNYPVSVYKNISYIVIVLFSIYISYDTQLMFMEAKTCRKYANYPRSSLKFILDVINIFVRTLSLQNR
jgi:FtsH-binding integral membrane protein